MEHVVAKTGNNVRMSVLIILLYILKVTYKIQVDKKSKWKLFEIKS